MQEFTQTSTFFWLFWTFTTAFGTLVGWWLRAALREHRFEQMLEIRDQERQHLAHQLQRAQDATDMKEADLKKAELALARLQTQTEAFDRERNLHIAAVQSAARQVLDCQQASQNFQLKMQTFEEQILGLRTRNSYLTGEIQHRSEEINAYKRLHADFAVVQKSIENLEEAVAQLENERNTAHRQLEMAWIEIDNLQNELVRKMKTNGSDNDPFNNEMPNASANGQRPAGKTAKYKIAAKKSVVAPPPPTTAEVAEDLKIINGISPFAEKMLNERGIRTIAAVAELDAPTVERLNAELGFFNGKIEREDWVGQARHLLSIAASSIA